MKKAISGMLLIGFVISASACGGQPAASSASVAAAENGYGSGAKIMLHATLHAGTSGEEGSTLSQTAITRPGVVFTGYTPSGGLLVGLSDKTALSQVEHWLRSQAEVFSVGEVPVPAGPPSSKISKP
jgi:hypothetical protein